MTGVACARSASHAGGDEDHVAVFEHRRQRVAIGHGRLFAQAGIAAGAQPMRHIRADLNPIGGLGVAQGLRVGVDHVKFDAWQTDIDHRIDGVAAAASDADHLDARCGPFFLLENEIAHRTPSYGNANGSGMGSASAEPIGGLRFFHGNASVRYERESSGFRRMRRIAIQPVEKRMALRKSALHAEKKRGRACASVKSENHAGQAFFNRLPSDRTIVRLADRRQTAQRNISPFSWQ